MVMEKTFEQKLLEDRRSRLIAIVHETGEFEERALIKAFADRINEEVTPPFSTAIRRVLRELVEYGVLRHRANRYSLRH